MSRWLLCLLAVTVAAIVALAIWVPRLPVWATIVGALTGLVGYAVFLWRRLLANKSMEDRALELLAEHRPEDAAIIYERLLGRLRRLHHGHAIVLYNLAGARMREGKLDASLALLSTVELGSSDAPILSYLVACELAMAFGYRGQVDAAEYWITEAKRRETPESGYVVLSAEMVVRCQGDRLEEFIAWSRDHMEQDPAREVDAWVMEELSLLTAYAKHRLGAPREAVEACLSSFKVRYPGGIDIHFANLPGFEDFAASFDVEK